MQNTIKEKEKIKFNTVYDRSHLLIILLLVHSSSPYPLSSSFSPLDADWSKTQLLARDKPLLSVERFSSAVDLEMKKQKVFSH